jgi:hypothetical protein
VTTLVANHSKQDNKTTKGGLKNPPFYISVTNPSTFFEITYLPKDGLPLYTLFFITIFLVELTLSAGIPLSTKRLFSI